MKKLYYFLLAIPCLIILSFASCSNDDTAPLLEDKYSTVSIKSDKSEINFFESINIYGQIEYPTGPPANIIGFDSVKININNLSYTGAYPEVQFEKTTMTRINHDLYWPGEHQILIAGYRGSNISETDTINVKVGEVKDFLAISWDNDEMWKNDKKFLRVGEDIYFGLSYARYYEKDNFKGNLYGMLEYELPNFLTIIAYDMDVKYWMKRYAESHEFLTNYISKLYGECVFEYNGSDITKTNLADEYNKRFGVPLNEILGHASFESLYPVAIWDTDTSHMALVGYPHTNVENSDTGNNSTLNIYYIIAEPRK